MPRNVRFTLAAGESSRQHHLRGSFEVFDTDELTKYWMDPFFGTIPHEHDEALVTLDLLEKRFEKVQTNYPKHKMRPMDRKSFEEITDVQDRLAKLIGHEVGEWSDIDIPMFCAQMEAHMFIISNDPKRYYEWIDYCVGLGLEAE